MSTPPTKPTTEPPADVAAAIHASDYPGEAVERLAVARGVGFPEAFSLIKEWQEQVLDQPATTALILPVEALPALRRAMAFVDFAAGEGLAFDDPERPYKDGAEEIMFDLATALGINDGEEYPAMLARFGLLP